MTDRDEMLAELRNVVEALGPYRAEVVIAGGFVPLVYRESVAFAPPRHAPLLSGDIDLTVPDRLAVTERRLSECLDEANFVAVLSRSTDPPVQYYQRREHGEATPGPYHVEFLAPLKGSSTQRDGTPKSPREIQPGINAQLLRFMDLLLSEPLDVAPFGDDLPVRVPNPAAYVVQKLLASERRGSPGKRDKDLAYIYDVALLTREMWATVGEDLEALRNEFPSSWFSKARSLAEDQFAAPDAIGPRAISRIMRDHDPMTAPTEGGAHRVVTRFLTEIGL